MPENSKELTDVHSISKEEKNRLIQLCKNAYFAGFSLVEIEEKYKVNRRTIRGWKDSENWDVLRDEQREAQLEILNSSQSELLKKSGEELAKIIYIYSREGARSVQEEGIEAMRTFPLKALTDAIDKLKRLLMHVESGGVTKSVTAKVDLSESLVQDLIMETCMELERHHPEINSRELIDSLFRNKMKKILDKVKA